MRAWVKNGSIVAAVAAAATALIWVGTLSGTVNTIRSSTFADVDKSRIEGLLVATQDSLQAVRRDLEAVRGQVAALSRAYTPPVSVQISTPTDMTSIARETLVRGTSQGLPAGESIWILVFDNARKRYYPFVKPADTQVGGDWTQLIEVGGYVDSGAQFQLIAVVPDSTATRRFRELTQPPRGDYPWSDGLTEIPSGVLEYDRVSVWRR